MDKPNIQLHIPYKLDNYNAIKRFLDAIKPIFPEQTTEDLRFFYSKSSNYTFSISEHSFINKECKGTEDFLNAIYRNERVNIASMTISNIEHDICLAFLNPSTLLLFAKKISVLEDYEARIKKALEIDAKQEKEQDVNQEAVFLEKHFGDMVFCSGIFNDKLIAVIKERIAEIEKAVTNDLPLAAIFLIGSTLEGVLSAVSLKYPREFNAANSAPRKDGNVLPLTCWVLGSLIDVAYEIGVLGKDVKDFSEKIRNFRNYIHPKEQVKQDFSPTMNTARISLQVLKAAINEINDYVGRNT